MKSTELKFVLLIQFIISRGLCNASQGTVFAPAPVSGGEKRSRGLMWPRSRPSMLTDNGETLEFNLLSDSQFQVTCSHLWTIHISHTDIKQNIVVISVFKMNERARACYAMGGAVFQGRKIEQSSIVSCLRMCVIFFICK